MHSFMDKHKSNKDIQNQMNTSVKQHAKEMLRLTFTALEDNSILFFVHNERTFLNEPIGRLTGQVTQLLFIKFHDECLFWI